MVQDARSAKCKISIINFHGNTSCGSEVVQCEQMDRQTDTTKLTVVFRNFAYSPENSKFLTLFSMYHKICEEFFFCSLNGLVFKIEAEFFYCTIRG
jgi:hypothetical protein